MDLLGNNVLREFDLPGPSGRFDRTAVMHQRSGGHISICGYMSLNLPLLRSWFSCLTFGIKGKMSRIVACGFSNTALTVDPPSQAHRTLMDACLQSGTWSLCFYSPALTTYRVSAGTATTKHFKRVRYDDWERLILYESMLCFIGNSGIKTLLFCQFFWSCAFSTIYSSVGLFTTICV